MKLTKKLFTALLALVMILSCFTAMPMTAEAGSSKVSIGYLMLDRYSYYDDVSTDNLTYVCLAFFRPCNRVYNSKGQLTGCDFECSVSSSKLKTIIDYYHSKHVAVIASFGGGSGGEAKYMEILRYNDATSIKNLASQMFYFARNNNFDGIDIDFEVQPASDTDHWSGNSYKDRTCSYRTWRTALWS